MFRDKELLNRKKKSVNRNRPRCDRDVWINSQNIFEQGNKYVKEFKQKMDTMNEQMDNLIRETETIKKNQMNSYDWKI